MSSLACSLFRSDCERAGRDSRSSLASWADREADAAFWVDSDTTESESACKGGRDRPDVDSCRFVYCAGGVKTDGMGVVGCEIVGVAGAVRSSPGFRNEPPRLLPGLLEFADPGSENR